MNLNEEVETALTEAVVNRAIEVSAGDTTEGLRRSLDALDMWRRARPTVWTNEGISTAALPPRFVWNGSAWVDASNPQDGDRVPLDEVRQAPEILFTDDNNNIGSVLDKIYGKSTL